MCTAPPPTPCWAKGKEEERKERERGGGERVRREGQNERTKRERENDGRVGPKNACARTCFFLSAPRKGVCVLSERVRWMAVQEVLVGQSQQRERGRKNERERERERRRKKGADRLQMCCCV
jgi:hypothetical protein